MEREFAGCLKCGSTEFLTELNSYDVVSLVDGSWSYIRSELADDNGEYYTCAACGEDIEVNASTQHRKIILRVATHEPRHLPHPQPLSGTPERGECFL